MSEIAGSPIGVMQRVLIEEIRSIPQGLLAPIDRVDHLFDAVKSREADLVSHGRAILGLTINAVDDMQFIAAGAMEYAAQVCPENSQADHNTLVKRSIPGLVIPAILSDGQWQHVRRGLSTLDDTKKMRRYLSPDNLWLINDIETQLPIISFSTSALMEIDSRIDVRGISGCPAQGIVIERSFTQFIDGIYGHTNATPTADSLSPSTNPLLIAQ